MHVAVIGAGIIGSNVAWRLAQKGATVTVLEADRPGGDTSGKSFAWVNAHRKPPRPYHNLNVLGMEAHRELCREFPDQTWWAGKGSVEWSKIGESAQDFEERISVLVGWDYKAEIISRDRLAELVPEIDASAFPDHQIGYFEDEAWVSPVLIIHRLLMAARALGAKVLTMTGPASLVIEGGRVTGVRVADGTIEADAVVNCTGRNVNSVVSDSALHVPMQPTRGLLGLTPPVTANPDLAIFGPEIEIRPDGAGRLMLHSVELDHQLKPDFDQEQIRDFSAKLVSSARELLPNLDEAPIEAVRIGTRALPADGLPVVGELPGLSNYTVVATHSGVTLSPWLGKAVANEVFDGVLHAELDDFRPSRFFGDSKPEARPWVRD